MTVTKAIDPGRPGMGKSLLWATGSFGCEREAWYGDQVRDENGHRLRFPMPERVHFGTAIDVLHANLTRAKRDREPVPLAGAAFESAVDLAYYAGLDGEWEEEPDRETFRLQIWNAARLLVGMVEGPKEQAPGVPLDWLPLEGLKIQGLDGVSLEVLADGRPVVGTPDYLWEDAEGTLLGWLDVKATARSFSYPDKWLGAEASLYSWLCVQQNGGILPGFAGYMEYRRLAKPYWHLTFTRDPAMLVRLADRYLNRWRKALAAGDPDLVSFSPKECADCPYSKPIDGVAFDGCPIGQIVNSQEGATEA